MMVPAFRCVVFASARSDRRSCKCEFVICRRNRGQDWRPCRSFRLRSRDQSRYETFLLAFPGHNVRNRQGIWRGHWVRRERSSVRRERGKMSMLWWVLVQFPRLRGVRGVMGVVMLRCGVTPYYWDSHLLED